MGEFSKEIRAYALKNAIEFGQANAGKILPKLFQHGLKKEEVGKFIHEIEKVVKEINSLSKNDAETQFLEYGKYVKIKEEKERVLPELENISENMVFRLAPYPSGALHIGNAKTYLLNALYAEKYNAKTLLVMDDTIGSEEKHIAPEAYKLIEDAFKELDVDYDKKIIYKSDRLEIYYMYGEKLILMDKAYVCQCSQEKLRNNRAKGIECECRSLSISEQMERWKKMFKSKPGEAVVRIKTDMLHPNPAFRDRVLFKISNREHPRVGKKYSVWPTLEMSWAIDDPMLGITHILRGNDLTIESDMERFIWDIFGWKHPVINHTGLIKIEGLESKLSKSKAQKEVESGEFKGWDDPRTWSIQSLVKRGIRREAIREFIEEIGLNKQDITVPIENLYAINRRLIDMEAKRYFLIQNPVELSVKNISAMNVVEMPIHPDKPEKRLVRLVPGRIYISEEDFKNNLNKEIRLLHLYNIKLGKNKDAEFISMENKAIPKVLWVSVPQVAKILMPDGKWISGWTDEHISELKSGDMIQFEKFGFCKFDKMNKKKEYEFWFGHK
ncbi:MAG: glutamate--tRNA ligase [archaeon]|nr:glutamate--tRNA ligase [archaeon]